MVMIDKLNWSSHTRELEADRSGWQPRNKAWKAERQALWQRINTGPYVSYVEGMGLPKKAKDIKIIEDFFLTGKSAYSVGKADNPVTLPLYLLFYPDLTVEVLDRIVPTLCPQQLQTDSISWLFPRWELHYMNYPEYFSARIQLLQNYFWPFNSKTKEVDAHCVDNLPNTLHSVLITYGLRYLMYTGVTDQPVVAVPEGWDNIRGLHYFFAHLALVNSVKSYCQESWYQFFLHLRCYTPWNALPGAGLEQQHAFVSTFIALIEQYGLPDALKTLWDKAGADSEVHDVTTEQLLDQANRVASILVCEHINCSVIHDIFTLYKANNFTDSDFTDIDLVPTEVSKLLNADCLSDFGLTNHGAIGAYSYTFALNASYSVCKQVVTLLLPVFSSEFVKKKLPRLIFVLRPFDASDNATSRQDKYRTIYMRRLVQQQLGLPFACMRNFADVYIAQRLDRNPKKHPLNEEERQQMQQSGRYKREQNYEPFIDKPYRIFSQVPTADDALPRYEGELPPFKFD
ncbi:hypothetical protein [Rheinheimera baltica]|uniref:hypothetical protein n=1 Tax=Rheinheimera baltica TaxID=67576 RepID=UPI0027402A04|nr:hypothetical protein [Rheinheimera baltica]MDP5191989.1 hypothetical protein [Rheinheimera baltica]